MNILAIDPATQLGYAYTKGKGIKSGTESFHNNKWDSAGARFLKFRAWLLLLPKPDVVAYESVESHSSTYAAHAYGGYIAVLQSFCDEYKIEYTGYPVGTIKKFWTGKGSAGKDLMIKAARERGFNPKDDNEADALAIYHLALTELSPSQSD